MCIKIVYEYCAWELWMSIVHKNCVQDYEWVLCIGTGYKNYKIIGIVHWIRTMNLFIGVIWNRKDYNVLVLDIVSVIQFPADPPNLPE